MRRLLVIPAATAALLLPASALAGGWAITAFDEVPAEFRAGETYRRGYTVLQHGQTPVRVDTAIVARSESGRQVSFPGRPEGPVGYYVAEVRFPRRGDGPGRSPRAPSDPSSSAP